MPPKASSNGCPWWNEKYGLLQFIRFSTQDESESKLDLAFWKIQSADLIHVTKSAGRCIVHLNFHECGQLTDDSIKYLSENWHLRGADRWSGTDASKLYAHLNHNLTHLNLSCCKQLTNLCCKYISSFARLLSLNLNDCILIDNRGLMDIMNGLKYLEEIHISNLNRLHDESMPFIIRNLVLMKRLHVMDFSGTRYSNEAFINFFESDPAPGILRNINVSRTKIELGMIGLKRSHAETKVKVITMQQLPNVLDSMLEWITSGCRGLQSIDLTDAGCVSDYAIGSLLECCQSLKKLNLRGCNTISDEAFKGLGECNLRDINVSRCSRLTSVSLIALASSCKNINRVSLQGIPKLCDLGFVPLARKCPLQEVDISAASLGNVPRFGSRGLITLGQNCSGLRILRANYCSKIDDACIIAVAKGCPRLERIYVKRCYKLSDKSLVAIGNNCHSLQRIDVSSCREITDNGIVSLVKGCRLLISVDFSNLGISDISIEELSYQCTNLSTICVQNCYEITDSSIAKLLYRCSLRSGTFVGCSASESVFQTMSTKPIFCELVPGAFVFHPIYSDPSAHKAHKLYILFLQQHVQIITCFIRAYWFEKRCRKSWRIKESASVRIQAVFRHYTATLKKCRKLELMRTIHDANLITAHFRGWVVRSYFLKMRKAVIYIQSFARRYNAKIKCMEMERQICSEIESNKNEIKRYEVHMKILALWRLWTVKILLHNKVTKIILIRRIQKHWRQRKQFRLNCRQDLKKLFRKWLHSFLNQTQQVAHSRITSAFAIQTCWRHRQDCQRLMYKIVAAHKEETDRISAANCIAVTLQSRWRSKVRKQLRREIIVGASNRSSRREAATLLQCWYRQRMSKYILDYKKKVVAFWKAIAKAAMHEKKVDEMLTVKKWFLHCEEERLLEKAALLLRSKIVTSYRKRKHMKVICRARELNAVLCIQSWWRLKRQRLWLLKFLSSVKKIQRMWKAMRFRHTIIELYKKERSRMIMLEARSKKDLLKLRIERKILTLFRGAKENAVLKIQREYRNYLIIKHAKEEEVHVLEMKETRTRKELEEWERLDDIIRHKQGNRKLMHSLTNVMGKANQSALRIIKNIRTHRHQSLEPSLARYHLLESTMKGTKSIIQDSNVKLFEEKLQQTFSNSSWWNKECLELSFQYLLWPKDFNALRRIWTESFAYKRENYITMIDFLGYVKEPKSEYASWLFPKLDIDRMSFPGYIRAITHAALLNKADILQLIFYSVTKDSLRKEDWDRLVKMLLSAEPISYPKRIAIEAFSKFTSQDVHKNNVLYFEDFKKITSHYPFLIQPFIRLAASVRKYHLGEIFWRAKRVEIERAYSIANKTIRE